jgi:hypothetical protein
VGTFQDVRIHAVRDYDLIAEGAGRARGAGTRAYAAAR